MLPQLLSGDHACAQVQLPRRKRDFPLSSRLVDFATASFEDNRELLLRLLPPQDKAWRPACEIRYVQIAIAMIDSAYDDELIRAGCRVMQKPDILGARRNVTDGSNSTKNPMCHTATKHQEATLSVWTKANYQEVVCRRHACGRHHGSKCYLSAVHAHY